MDIESRSGFHQVHPLFLVVIRVREKKANETVTTRNWRGRAAACQGNFENSFAIWSEPDFKIEAARGAIGTSSIPMVLE